MLRMKFGDPKYVPLDRQWSAENAYLDLAASAVDATEHFRSRGDHELEEFFGRSTTIQNAHCQYPTV